MEHMTAAMTEWDEEVIHQLLEKVTVLSREKIRVTFRAVSYTHLDVYKRQVILYLAIAVISLVTLLILSPSEAKNKPLTPEQRRRNRRRSLILGGLNLAIGIFLIWGLQAPAPWCTSYYLGVIAASISMWAAQIKERMCVQ